MTTLLLPSDASGCGWYRMAYPAALAGPDVRLIWPDSDDRPDIRLSEVGIDGRQHLQGIDVAPDVDVVVFQRPAGYLHYEAMKALQARGIRCVVEIDDDLHRLQPTNNGWAALDPARSPDVNVRWLERATELAEWRIFSTPELYESYGKPGDWVVPNYIPKALLEVEGLREWEGVRIGWGGWTPNHPGDLDVAGPGVRRALRELDGRFYVVGPREGPGRRENRVSKALGISEKAVFATGWVTTPAYPRSISASFNLGLVPLARNAFNRGKSWLKGLEYSALGVCTIASPTPDYRRLAEVVDIRLAEGPAEWSRELRWLVKHPEAVIEAGKCAREAVSAANLTVEAHFGDFAAAWAAPRPS
jgi:hypothetical protein